MWFRRIVESRYRNEAEIIADILRVVKPGARKTRIMYGANLSFMLAKKYITKLSSMDLIRLDSDQKTYQLTEKGKTYLDNYQSYQKIERDLKSALQHRAVELDKILHGETDQT